MYWFLLGSSLGKAFALKKPFFFCFDCHFALTVVKSPFLKWLPNKASSDYPSVLGLYFNTLRCIKMGGWDLQVQPDLEKELLHVSQTTADLEGKFTSVTEFLPVSTNTVPVLLRFYFLFSQRLLLGDFKSQLTACAVHVSDSQSNLALLIGKGFQSKEKHHPILSLVITFSSFTVIKNYIWCISSWSLWGCQVCLFPEVHV